jgi:hypothetical protein
MGGAYCFREDMNMSKAQKDVFVKVDEEFTYRMDTSRTRTLPPGWTGAISADAAKELKKEKKGQVLSTQAASQRKAAAKTGAGEGANTDDQGNSVNEGNDDDAGANDNEKDAEQ